MDNSKFSLNNKIAIVTGSGRGIGKAIAFGLAVAGAKVVLVARTLSDIDIVAKEIQTQGGTATPIRSDVKNSQDVDELMRQIMKKYGRVDILVNNAGGQTQVAPALELSEESWESDINWNLKSQFLCAQSAARIMVKQKNGNIINIGSAAGSRPVPGLVAYSVAKAGVAQLTKALAVEWARYGIRVNAIVPGMTVTPLTEKLYETRPKEDKQMVLEFTPLGRHGAPEDFIGLAVYLASDASSWMTGAVIPLDGGIGVVSPTRKRGLATSMW